MRSTAASGSLRKALLFSVSGLVLEVAIAAIVKNISRVPVVSSPHAVHRAVNVEIAEPSVPPPPHSAGSSHLREEFAGRARLRTRRQNSRFRRRHLQDQSGASNPLRNVLGATLTGLDSLVNPCLLPSSNAQEDGGDTVQPSAQALPACPIEYSLFRDAGATSYGGIANYECRSECPSGLQDDGAMGCIFSSYRHRGYLSLQDCVEAGEVTECERCAWLLWYPECENRFLASQCGGDCRPREPPDALNCTALLDGDNVNATDTT
jgi:hypothetical protein